MKKTFQPLPHTDCVLSDSRLDVWQFSLNRPPTEAEHRRLSEDEQARAKQFYFERHRRRFIIARATLRHIIARYLNTHASELCFTYNAHGKPHLDSPLQFNLSHSGELALLSIGSQHANGIDLEFFSPRPYVNLAQQLFSDKEMLGLHAMPLSLLPLAFFHVWSQKEAFIKAIGSGLSYPTQQITLPLLPSTDDVFIDPLDLTPWKITSFMPTTEFCAALCYHPSIHTLRYTTEPLL